MGYIVSGYCTRELGQVEPGATVDILSVADMSVVNTGISDSAGFYEISVSDDSPVFVLITFNRGSSWFGSVPVSIGDRVYVDSIKSAFFECTTGGTTGSTEPEWKINEQINDNGVIWKSIGNLQPSISGPIFPDEEVFDFYQNNVSLFVEGNGAHYAQSMPDSSRLNRPVVTIGDAKTVTNTYKSGYSSMFFDGDRDYLQIDGLSTPLPFSGKPFTIECWLRPEGVDSLERNLGIYGATIHTSNGEQTWNLDRNSGMPYIDRRSNNGGSLPIVRTKMVGSQYHRWAYYAHSYDGANHHNYINGQRIGLTPDSVGWNGDDTRFTIGSSNGTTESSSRFDFHGYIDSFKITSGVAKFDTPTIPIPKTLNQKQGGTILPIVNSGGEGGDYSTGWTVEYGTFRSGTDGRGFQGGSNNSDAKQYQDLDIPGGIDLTDGWEVFYGFDLWSITGTDPDTSEGTLRFLDSGDSVIDSQISSGLVNSESKTPHAIIADIPTNAAKIRIAMRMTRGATGTANNGRFYDPFVAIREKP